MGKTYDGRSTSQMFKEDVFATYKEYNKFLNNLDKNNPSIASQIEGFDEIKSTFKEFNDVMEAMTPLHHTDVIEYRQYVYCMKENMGRINEVMEKYHVNEQVMKLLGDNKNDELHYPFPNINQEAEFQKRFGAALAVKWNDNKDVLRHLCLHVRDMGDKVKEYNEAIESDLEYVNTLISEERKQHEAYLNNPDHEMTMETYEMGERVFGTKNMKEALNLRKEIEQEYQQYLKADQDTEEGLKNKAKIINERLKKNHEYHDVYKTVYGIKSKTLGQEAENSVDSKYDLSGMRGSESYSNNIKIDQSVDEPNRPNEAQNPEEERLEFKKIAEALKKAKTTVNSKQYRDLITIFDTLGSKKNAGMSDVDKKRLLAKAGKTVNEYIAHKAKDGIKPNVFKKLAAVEAASRILDKKLAPYKDETLQISKDESISVKDLNLSLASKLAKTKGDEKESYNRFQSDVKTEPMINAITNPKLKLLCELAGVFMNKILLNAVQKKNPAASTINTIRGDFANQEYIKQNCLQPEERKLEKPDSIGLNL